jgi:hypothetical protein
VHARRGTDLHALTVADTDAIALTVADPDAAADGPADAGDHTSTAADDPADAVTERGALRLASHLAFEGAFR